VDKKDLTISALSGKIVRYWYLLILGGWLFVSREIHTPAKSITLKWKHHPRKRGETICSTISR
jgi:hypothetical protein